VPTVQAVRDAIWREGETITLQRVVTGQAPASVTCLAMVREYRPNELVGDLQQGDRLVLISDAEIAAAGWPGPPQRGDQVLTGDGAYTVQANNVTRLRGAVAKHMLTVRG
jgi:hypothetical protein